MSLSAKKLYLVDGTSFCYRAYYAIRSLSNSKGEPTNAIYGFVTMLSKLLAEGKPDYTAICFDRPEPTFRHGDYAAYKANRKPTPDDLVSQLEPIREFCRAFHWAFFEKPGYEADDLLGTLARRGAEEGMEVFIVTSDKDFLQLVTDKVKVLNPGKDNLIYDIAGVKKRFEGMGPEKVIDIMAIMGDASDNVPGVPGIGEKGALKLIKEFGSLENLLKYASKVKSKSQQALLKEHGEQALLCKKLVSIATDVPMDVDWEAVRLGAPDPNKLAELCKRYEFRALLKQYTPAGETRESKRVYQTVESEKDLAKLTALLEKAKAFSFDTETTAVDPMRADLVGLSFSWAEYHAAYVPVSSAKHSGPGLALETVLNILKPLLENTKLAKYGQNAKYDWIVLKRHGIEVRGIGFDTMIASYLINPVKLNHNLDDISLEQLGVKKITTESLLGKGKEQRTMAEVPLAQIAEYAAEDADCVFRLVPIFKAKLEENELTGLFEKTELPLALCLGRMEMNGVALDLEMLKKLSDETGAQLEKLTVLIYEGAGGEFNINSTKQLAEILFEKLKLPAQKKTKTGYSTDVSVLEKLAETYELPRKLLEYREKSKLKSTYLDALPEMVNPETGCVHTSYHQTTTVTGRLSSSDPNLQNIPIKTADGRQVRRAFVSRYGVKGKILSADYSQIELRLLAHLSGDENLSRAFVEDRDIHRYTATLLYGVQEKEVTREMRDVAKTINFSIIYGKTAYGLSQDLGISVQEADQFIRDYFSRYEAIKAYMDGQKEKARQDGFLTTLLGRRSYFPDLNSSNGQLRQFAERAAVNAPIQGSAADLIKLAMLKIEKRLEREAPRSLMIMQVHDELVFDVPAESVESVTELVRAEMESAYTLKVPLKVDVTVGDSWYKG
ncbi:MAG: DNA polymerase I [Candidatus Omnitrophica bacterium]|nr:DNA polymerase I [Candidatus Omnitrophota bacterium]